MTTRRPAAATQKRGRVSPAMHCEVLLRHGCPTCCNPPYYQKHVALRSAPVACNAVLAGAPKATTNKLQRVLNAAARVVSGTHKFDRGLSRLLHTELHWLDVRERVVYKLGIMETACTVKRLSTSWNCASQSQVSHHGNIFAPLPSGSWSYRVTSSPPMANGLSVWLVRRSGIPCRTTCGIRLLAGTVLDNL